MDKNSKLRPLYIAKILYELTDEDHCLTTPEIISILESEYGITGYRTTIAADIELLTEFGMDIEVIKSSSNMYHMVSRLFDQPELKLLIDAVGASKFITCKKSRELTQKLSSLASRKHSDTLLSHVHIDGRVKPENESAYYIVDAINEAILKKKKISFQYSRTTLGKTRQLRFNGMHYVFSPFDLVWHGDYYYMIGVLDKHTDISCFRVDRISKQPNILEQDSSPIPDEYDPNEVIYKSFRMYSGHTETVELVCDNTLVDAIIDRFGKNVDIIPYDDGTFGVKVNLAANHVFFSWIFGFGGKVSIKAPEGVRNDYREMVKKEYTKLFEKHSDG